ncbi:MAG TPA: maleylpyruvate isomerase N-terminal domain-containing protein [Thermoanaerobaculia bacterium]|nr:maleylpyruvate isomerase N-terminal domain-containing protein [Thermoanaerobaculia bacterium]
MKPSTALPGLSRLAPTYTAELFAPLHGELMALLRGLAPADWERPTIAGAWRVRDVAAHLLDGDLRKLSGQRDGQRLGPEGPIDGYRDLVAWIDAENASGVAFAQRLSPRLLVDLLEITGRWVADFVVVLDPHASAWISVLWAGETRSENWMDTGREYTERWHHQMQIRDAVKAPHLFADRWLRPLLDLSVRALPPAYAETEAPEGTTVTLAVTAESRMAWTLVREGGGWSLYGGEPQPPAAAGTTVTAGPATVWRLFYNALSRTAAPAVITVSGETRLAEPLLLARSVMV